MSLLDLSSCIHQAEAGVSILETVPFSALKSKDIHPSRTPQLERSAWRLGGGDHHRVTFQATSRSILGGWTPNIEPFRGDSGVHEPCGRWSGANETGSNNGHGLNLIDLWMSSNLRM